MANMWACADPQSFHSLLITHIYRVVQKSGHPTQLLIFVQNYKTVHVLGQQTWTALVNSLPVAKIIQNLPMTLELSEIAATALAAGQCGYALTRVHPVMVKLRVGIAWVVSMRRAINSVTGDTFWKPVTGWKPIYQLTGYRFNKPNGIYFS